ncbi:unnamed protein product [Mytilus edulis]|uniref:COR domain-containing protein n=1 Tax=Mytilus edulis TaxID=6550 RepID=A0A8S3QHB5_MYTED|nr:unnamed protein product [Mytilus edulis]
MKLEKSRPGFGKLMPVRFIQLEKSIDRKLQAGTQFLSFGDVKVLAEKIGAITDIAELDVFLRYHHDFGNLIYFKDIPEYIILNPQWLVNVFRLLVTAGEFRDKLIWHDEWDIYETTGKLTKNMLRCIFENQSDDIIKCKEHILKIMEKFDIIVRPRMIIDGKEQTKKAAECQTEQENTIIAQNKDVDRFCFEIHVQKNTNKLETYGNPAYLLQSRKQCDITFLYGEHRRMNKHKPSNSSKRRCPWGGSGQILRALIMP